MEIGDVADRQPQNLDLREFLVGRKRRQQFPQFGERDVERLDPDALPRRMRNAVLKRRAPAPTPLLARQVRRYFHFRFRRRRHTAAVARRPDTSAAAAARVHRLVGLGHVTIATTGSGWDAAAVGGVATFARGVPHSDGGLLEKRGVCRNRNCYALRRVQVESRMGNLVVVAAVETTAVVIVIIVVMLVKLMLLLMVMMMGAVRHLTVDRRQSRSHPHP